MLSLPQSVTDSPGCQTRSFSSPVSHGLDLQPFAFKILCCSLLPDRFCKMHQRQGDRNISVVFPAWFHVWLMCYDYCFAFNDFEKMCNLVLLKKKKIQVLFCSPTAPKMKACRSTSCSSGCRMKVINEVKWKTPTFLKKNKKQFF